MTPVCPRCKSTNLEAGSLAGAAIQLDRASTLKKVFAPPEVKATVCMDCGAIELLRADPAKLAHFLGK